MGVATLSPINVWSWILSSQKRNGPQMARQTSATTRSNVSSSVRIRRHDTGTGYRECSFRVLDGAQPELRPWRGNLCGIPQRSRRTRTVLSQRTPPVILWVPWCRPCPVQLPKASLH
ncbi:hypothetical protein M404DRAFT_743043 [Pisolithus tinctorius Marx 270]|uniref:Uncharacterized protein n=1 Tax=Pisolithus tinctorius Marx 270 TaxID=870435 RepID=A0A0C3JUL0_PISTI|nr:hypothetical protein M404DRAFT_743043 [Pisolithus tinctorius Marx 270]